MYRCPHCKKLTISGLTQFYPPFDGRVQCSNCHAEVKVKKKFTNFLVPIYILIRAFSGLIFGIRPNLSFFTELTLLLFVCFIQVRFISYEVVQNP